ncbi:IS3 family transposase [Lactobacillus gasseri]|uniref:IS3 family transposase n=2 Tax=Lactobacillaceae TaxID=33958 RepID=UPI00336A3EBB
MSKLTKKDKLNIYKEWTIENKRSTYLSKKYGIGSVSIKYLVSLIHRHGMDILDKPHTYYSAQFKLNRVLVNHEAAYSVSLELGLKSQGMLINWIRSYKENGYNVVIKRKGRRTREQRTREIEERKRRIASPEFKAYCRERIYKKIGCLGSKEKKPTKTEIAQAVRELRLELGLGVKTILSILNDLNNDLPGLSRSNYYDILKREDQDEIRHHSLIKRIKEIFFELKDRYTAPGYRTITDHLHSEGFIINRKTVYRLMRKLNLIGYRMKRRRRYNSFEGEIEGRIKPNLIKRNFFAIRPNMKWYTDITEFNLRGQKLYLSPIIDGCGRDIVAYNISRSPNLQQVMTMLDDAFKVNDSLNGLVFHSDRGWQYQHKTYQYELARRGIEQSMSRKGCSPDDGLMEGFFGILKREMFYGKESNYANLNELEQAIKDYIHFYNYERTKSKLSIKSINLDHNSLS